MDRNRHMVGVVVSWDPELRAPSEWVDMMYSSPEVSSHNRFPLFTNILFHKLSV